MSDEDSNPTPPISPPPKYLAEYGSAPHHGPSDPRVYLQQEPTRDEQRIIDACDREAGGHAPFFAVVKIAVRLERLVLFIRNDISSAIEGLATAIAPGRIERLEAYDRRQSAMLKRAKRWVMAAVSAAALNLGGMVIYLQNRAETNGAQREHAANVDRAIDSLQKDIADLRTLIWQLRKLSDRTVPADVSVVYAAPTQEPHHDSPTTPIPDRVLVDPGAGSAAAHTTGAATVMRRAQLLGQQRMRQAVRMQLLLRRDLHQHHASEDTE